MLMCHQPTIVLDLIPGSIDCMAANGDQADYHQDGRTTRILLQHRYLAAKMQSGAADAQDPLVTDCLSH